MSITAKYYGRCAAECGRPVRPGDEVVFDDGVMHADCVDALMMPKPAEVCTSCWLEKPCPCEDGL